MLPPDERPALRIDFVNGGITKNDNFFHNLLATRYRVQLEDKPDFVLFNHAGHKHRLLNAVRIFWSQETMRGDFAECDYALTTFAPQSDREYRLPYYAQAMEPGDLVRPAGLDYEKIAAEKTAFCAFVASYSNKNTTARVEFFQRLSRYKKVDSGGRLFNNIGGPVPGGLIGKRAWLRQYKFHIAFENSSVPGYVTEKLPDALLAQTVPIYWGAPDVVKDFNPASFINAHDFPSFDALVEHVAIVDADPALYLQYLSAPPYHGNTPNEAMDRGKLLAFFHRIFTTPIEPVAAKEWRWRGNRWRLAKRDKWEKINFLDAAGARPPSA
ncbi:MAG TPA: glycosyltransferase family 10 [Opitutales bacterium]|nr:glycosyltransferase family 10 [Opitutales bacterium]